MLRWPHVFLRRRQQHVHRGDCRDERGKADGVWVSSVIDEICHDFLGRVANSEQRTPATSATPFQFSYSYYANDSLAGETFPSQRQVTNCYDGLGRVRWVSNIHTSTDCMGGATIPTGEAYASNLLFAPHGAIQQLQLGSGLYEQDCFNARLQTIGIRLGGVTTSGCANSSDLLNISYGYLDNFELQQRQRAGADGCSQRRLRGLSVLPI